MEDTTSSARRAGAQDGGHTASTSSTSAAYLRSAQSPLRSRRPAPSPRQSESPSGSRFSLSRRRSSMMSLGSDLSAESFRSSTNDLFLPRADRYGKLHGSGDDMESSSHLHSLPLVLAIVPAVMGVFIQNGAVVMTDITLLAIAAVFLNWSIRIPWDWYHSAQAIRHHDSINTEDFLPAGDDNVIVEENEDEVDDESRKDEPAAGAENDTSAADGKNTEPQSSNSNDTSAHDHRRLQGVSKSTATAEQLSAASQLRWHEILALLTCFIGPIAGAGLLHAIREQLSRPSEGLVSNYNLSIFLLAAEIRPLSHLIKLIQNRTLHLQRVVARDVHRSASGRTDIGGIPATNDALAALAARIAAIEAGQLQSPVGEMVSGELSPGTATPFPAVSKEQMVADTRRAMQPEIDALNRAVRRYEKRATLLSLQVDGRLSALESRAADAIALAAAAERSANGSRRGSAATLVEWIASCVVMPIRAVAWIAKRILEIPNRLTSWILGLAKEVIGMVKGKDGAKEMRRRGEPRQRPRTKDVDAPRLKAKRPI